MKNLDEISVPSVCCSCSRLGYQIHLKFHIMLSASASGDQMSRISGDCPPNFMDCPQIKSHTKIVPGYCVMSLIIHKFCDLKRNNVNLKNKCLCLDNVLQKF